MIKNSKFLLILIISLIVPLTTADKAGVVIFFPDGSISGECLETSEGINGYDLLQKLSLPTSWAGPSSFGHMLCKINNIGNDVSGNFCSFSSDKFWRFSLAKKNIWQSMPVGFDGGNSCWNNDFNPFGDHYCVNNNDIIGLDFVEFDDPFPAFYTFDDICNPAKFKNVRVYVNGKKQANADEEGGSIEAKPGSTILFKIEVENSYIFKEEIKVENIEAEITIENINGKDIEEKIKFKDLGIDENDENEAKFNIPLVLEDDSYEIELKLTGKANGIKQEIIANYDLEIDRKKHDLILSKIELENLESCQNNSNKLTLEVTNIGEKDEDVFLTIKNSDINIDFSDRFKLKKSSSSTYIKEVGFKIPFVKPGDYEININLDYSQNTNEKATLTVKDCTQLNEKIMQISPVENNPQRLQLTKPIQQYKKSFLDIYVVPILLGVFLVFLIISIILIITILNK